MSIIVQCGHELTRSEELMNVLNERGLSEPLKSSRTGLSSSEVAIALDKIYKKTGKLIDNKLAESVAIDFLLTNLEMESWGWSSNKNLIALHFWEWLEPDCKFVLVFDHPTEIFRYAIKNNLSQSLLDSMIEDWIVFQKELLRFFINNKNKCVLLEGKAALVNTKDTKKCINFIAPDLYFKSKKFMNNEEVFENKVLPSFMDNTDQKEILNNKLIYELLNAYPELINTFNDLLEKSSVKNNDEFMYKENLKREDIYSVVKEMQNLGNDHDQSIIDSLKIELKEKESSVEELKSLLNYRENNNKELADTIQRLKQKSESGTHSLKQKKTVIDPIEKDSNELINLKRENKIILRQLHLVQKELEHYLNLRMSEKNKKFQNNRNTKSSEKIYRSEDSKIVKKLEENITHEMPKEVPFGVEKRIKTELPYRVGASIIENSKSRKGILNIPKAIAMEYIDYNKNLKSISSLPSIEDYGDFDKAEKIKQHLSYQIGEVVAESIKEPKKIITAPIKIGNRVLSFKKAKFIQKKK